ncbi:GntR family transcriptional regulator [Paracoccus litorisediminis]|jgi:DNA-binding GntR family transcriptional regulator|uniref:GntR family transcriptional regulator n=1 Tax=Paracoccus litorisediminis TaxID=2006130 RepID=A0A844HRP5_9RHOB|nr:GntR family transcriptional regulator [Paracoccus litorisediminis]MTH61007.1 GntR family transcriptional regulator [Paracoccus litorisediminis]
MESTHETASTDKQRTVLEAVAEMIVARGIGVGERLPPELDLARDLGAARSTVREALKAWQGMGVVSRNKGAGTVLRVPISGKSMQVRRPIEAEACRLAALRANDRQRTEIIHRAMTGGRRITAFTMRSTMLQETRCSSNWWISCSTHFTRSIATRSGHRSLGPLRFGCICRWPRRSATAIQTGQWR